MSVEDCCSTYHYKYRTISLSSVKLFLTLRYKPCQLRQKGKAGDKTCHIVSKKWFIFNFDIVFGSYRSKEFMSNDKYEQ